MHRKAVNTLVLILRCHETQLLLRLITMHMCIRLMLAGSLLRREHIAISPVNVPIYELRNDYKAH